MAIRPILRMGHPVLRQKARDLSMTEIHSPATKQLLQDMLESMHAADGLGIAAPQIGESVRVSIIEFAADNNRYPGMGQQGLTVFINPKLTVLESTEQGFWEGCLSVPDLRGLVFRPRKVAVDYLDENGKAHHLEAEGFLATVLQHEFDHLDGILYVDRVKDSTKLAYLDEYKSYILSQQDHDEIED